MVILVVGYKEAPCKGVCDDPCMGYGRLSYFKQVSGSTPKELIDNVVVAEIKVMLRYTDLTVQQIAYHLNISSESFLCRFFRRMTGFTPLEYRNKTML